MIKKAVIPCGGRGTRFLPITKAVPKEILPIVDTPVLQYIADEIIASGISEICIILSPGKEAIKHYFRPDPQLEEALMSCGKTEEYDLIKKISASADIVFEYQDEPKGSADAVYRAKNFVGEQDFALCLGDDLMVSDVPVTKQLVEVYNRTGRSVIGVQKIMTDDIVKYGVIDGCGDGDVISCRRITEKPPLDALPSRYACLGRYVLTKDFFEVAQGLKPGIGGEYQLTDAINIMCGKSVYAYCFEGKRYDMGNKLEAAKATVEFMLRGPYGKQFSDYLKTLLGSLL